MGSFGAAKPVLNSIPASQRLRKLCVGELPLVYQVCWFAPMPEVFRP